MAVACDPVSYTHLSYFELGNTLRAIAAPQAEYDLWISLENIAGNHINRKITTIACKPTFAAPPIEVDVYKRQMQPIVIQCDLPQAVNKLTAQADGINWELEEIRKTLPELKTRIDLTSVQKSLMEMQKSLAEMNKLLERVGNLSEKHSSKWIGWLPDFSLLVALKWIALLLVIGAAALAGWYGVAAIRGLFL